MNLLLKLNQLQFPKEFRIYPSQVNSELNSGLSNLVTSLDELLKSNSKQEKIDDKEADKLIAEIGTGLWRLRNKMVDKNSKQPYAEMSKAYRHLDTIWTVLEQSDIKIIDHTGELFDDGKSYKALAFEPAAGIDRETIIETIKPSIFKNKFRIQMGEVIVGSPSN